MSADPITELEAELADTWRRGRNRTRSRAHAIDPRLDPSAYPVITILAGHESLPMSRLVHELGLDKSTVTRQVDAVVRLGLVERSPDHMTRGRGSSASPTPDAVDTTRLSPRRWSSGVSAWPSGIPRTSGHSPTCSTD